VHFLVIPKDKVRAVCVYVCVCVCVCVCVSLINPLSPSQHIYTGGSQPCGQRH
jgi:hypothetical protein